MPSEKGCGCSMTNESRLLKMGVVGERDVVTAFKALGMQVIPVLQPDDTAHAIHQLVTSGVPVIFITEGCAQHAAEIMERYKTDPAVTIIPIPGSQGTNGFGRNRVRANVEKAIGADILFDQRKEET